MFLLLNRCFKSDSRRVSSIFHALKGLEQNVDPADLSVKCG